MTQNPPIRIASISDNPDPDWVWIRDLIDREFAVGGRKLVWEAFSTAPARAFETGPLLAVSRRIQSLARQRGADTLVKAHKANPFDLVVSHGPLTTAWTETALRPSKGAARHLGFSFNFTDLPNGLRKRLMTAAFRTVNAFAVFTDGEIGLYERYFGIQDERLLRAPWGVAAPLVAPPQREIDGTYVAALGGEARDYRTLCEAARLQPETRFVAIARPHNFSNLETPPNLTVLFNLPFERAWGIVWHSAAALIPLRSRETPCGLVSLVGGMHLGKAQIVTDAMGVADYLRDGETGLLTPANDATALAEAVARLLRDPALTRRLGDNAKSFAQAKCSEAATVAFFQDLLKRWFG